MTINLNPSRRIAYVVLLAAVALSACTVAATAPSPAVQQKIEAARTRTDHEALVAFYNAEAATARGKAAEHQKMAKGYQNLVASGRSGANMPAHCNSIVNSYESVATEFDAMAASHRQMADQAKP